MAGPTLPKIGYFDIFGNTGRRSGTCSEATSEKSGMRHALKVVASTEAPRRRAVIELNEQNKRSSYGTIITIPAIFGIYLANHVIMKLIE